MWSWLEKTSLEARTNPSGGPISQYDPMCLRRVSFPSLPGASLPLLGDFPACLAPLQITKHLEAEPSHSL